MFEIVRFTNRTIIYSLVTVSVYIHVYTIYTYLSYTPRLLQPWKNDMIIPYHPNDPPGTPGLVFFCHPQKDAEICEKNPVRNLLKNRD